MRRAFYKWCALQCAAQRGETAASTARQLGLPKIAAQRDFWERGAAGVAGKAASTARRLPWRLDATSASAGFPLPHGKFFCQLKRIFANKILAQAKPRFCAGAPNLRGSARAGKVKAVRVLHWCALKKRTAEENSGCAALQARTAGLSSNHGVPQASARRGTRELNLSKKEK